MSILIGLIKALVPQLPAKEKLDQVYLNDSVDPFEVERRMSEIKHRSHDFPWLVPAFNFKMLMTTISAQLGWISMVPALMSRGASGLHALPFDMAREQYAMAVKVGLVERSMLKAAKFGRALYALEKLMLGPMARKY